MTSCFCESLHPTFFPILQQQLAPYHCAAHYAPFHPPDRAHLYHCRTILSHSQQEQALPSPLLPNHHLTTIPQQQSVICEDWVSQKRRRFSPGSDSKPSLPYQYPRYIVAGRWLLPPFSVSPLSPHRSVPASSVSYPGCTTIGHFDSAEHPLVTGHAVHRSMSCSLRNFSASPEPSAKWERAGAPSPSPSPLASRPSYPPS